MLAPKPCPSSEARMLSPTQSCCRWWRQVTLTHTHVHEMESSGSYLIPILSPDGTPQDGDTLSPTDIEANLSTEVALTVLDVLELFVHHHKVRRPHIVHHQTLHRACLVFLWWTFTLMCWVLYIQCMLNNSDIWNPWKFLFYYGICAQSFKLLPFRNKHKHKH